VSGDRVSVPAVVEMASPMLASTVHGSLAVPAAIAAAGDHAARGFLEFFAATMGDCAIAP
jgi:hypothetical protein